MTDFLPTEARLQVPDDSLTDLHCQAAILPDVEAEEYRLPVTVHSSPEDREFFVGKILAPAPSRAFF